MATYKVIQDIEAEDKLVGPFSLRQFIYAGIAAFCGYLSVIAVTKNAAFLLAIFVPPMLFCMFFAWPWSPDQPTEVWALARIRFLFKPRKRIWDQSGVKELVTITVPKKIEKVYTDGLSQTEVKSRLQALADTIDSRGWVIKNSNVNLSAASQYAMQGSAASDRLVSYSAIPQQVPDYDITPSDDMLDEQNNPVAQQFDQMITASSEQHRQQLMDRLRANGATVPGPAPNATQQQPNDYWFLHQLQAPASGNPSDVVFTNPQLVQPGVQTPPVAAPAASDEAAFAAVLQNQASTQQAYDSHLKTMDPATGQVSDPARTATPAAPQATPQPAQPNPVNIDLARNNDLDVATLARQAKKAQEQQLGPDDEVVISLH